MKRFSRFTCIFLTLVLLMTGSVFATESSNSALGEPSIEYWPELRWWLAAGSHTDETLLREIDLIYESGFGAVEFLAMPESNLDYSLYGWGSEEWVHDSMVIIQRCTELGMGVSLTSGTHWATANLPNIVPDDEAASKTLSHVEERLSAGETWEGPLTKYDNLPDGATEQLLIAVVAAKIVRDEESEDGQTTVLDFDTLIDLTDSVIEINGDRAITWTAPEDGEYALITFWMHGTAQYSEPSVGTNYCVNYMDSYGSQAVIDYWSETILTDELIETIQENGRVQLYMDSLEVNANGSTGLLWGYNFLDEFEARRGYDLKPYLPLVLATQGSWMSSSNTYPYVAEGNEELIDKIRNDLYATLTDMYKYNVLEPLANWLHSIGMTLRAEPSYGRTFEISEPAVFLDGIETESLEFGAQIESFRNFSGAAHLYGIQLSSETAAEPIGNYYYPLNHATQIVFRQFASGISRTVFHGYSSIRGADGTTQWPGHEGMYTDVTERLNERQPGYDYYKEWTSMIARFQEILNAGDPQVDLLMLRTDYNLNIPMTSSYSILVDDAMLSNVPYYWMDTTLQNAGYTYDYASPQLLLDAENVAYADGYVNPDGVAYKAIIIYQDILPLESAKTLCTWAQQGLPIIILNNAEAEYVKRVVPDGRTDAATATPYNDGNDEALQAVMSEMKALSNVVEIDDAGDAYAVLMEMGVTPRVEYVEPNNNIFTMSRVDGNMRYVYAYNAQYGDAEAYTVEMRLEGEGKPYLYDAWTDELCEVGLYAAKDGATTFPLTLEPGEAAVVFLDMGATEEKSPISTDAYRLISEDGAYQIMAIESGEYSVEFSDGTGASIQVEALEPIALETWNLVVEDWNEGEKIYVTEDRGMGYVTTEVYFETEKTPIEVGETELIPWKDIEAVGPEVSGMGYYTTTFELPANYSADNGALLDLGSTSGSLAVAYVNGTKTKEIDMNNPVLDITDLLVEGTNEIYVEVASSLRNRVLARGYYDSLKGPGVALIKTRVPDSYGLIGEANVTFYTLAEID